ncbi:MAG: hypothetical protein K2K47_06505 [Duncaniella sp.]|nr:hypothetical protein [Duncaniella sp.]
MSENKESNNIGCIVSIALLVIGSLVYFFATESSESVAETGSVLLTIAGLAISYYVCKALFSNKSEYTNRTKTYTPKTTTSVVTSRTNSDDNSNKSSWGCIFTSLACVVVTIIVVSEITSSFSFNYAIGISFTIILAIVIGVTIYKSFRE